MTTESPMRTSAWPMAPSSPIRPSSSASNARFVKSMNSAAPRTITNGVTVP